VTAAADALRAVAPALAFLLAGVPLAALLDDLGFFDAAAGALEARAPHLPVAGLWWLAAATTVVLNLDTTVVLLTPLYVRMARRAGVDPLPLALIPLLLAAFASSVLPVSNLTTLIAADRVGLTVAAVVGHLALPSLAAATAGWLAYRRRHPVGLVARPPADIDRRALRIGGVVVAALLVGFTAGPSVGVAPWAVAAAADVFLAALLRRLPWRSVPVVTAAAVGAVAMAVGAWVPLGWLGPVRTTAHPLGALAAAGGGTVAAALVNNIPATLLVVDGAHAASAGVWGWLVGVNVGSVLVPTGALANLLWLRIVRDEGLSVDVRCYLRSVIPIAVPALAAAAAALVVVTVLA
jgi:arsenical pump membrane protein